MKTMNPGCNCCHRVLVWAMGIPQVTALGEFEIFWDAGHTQTQTAHVDWSVTESRLKEFGATVDFALGTPTPAREFWGPIGQLISNDESLPSCPVGNWGPPFDPETDGVDLEYWTGDIHDYTMIIWDRPLSTATPGKELCNFIPPVATNNLPCLALEASDNWWVHGGLPSWYDAVFNGTWKGRIVVAQTFGMLRGSLDSITGGSFGWWPTFGLTSSRFFEEDEPVHGIGFNYHAVNPVTSPATMFEDDLTAGVGPLVTAGPDIIGGKTLATNVQQVADESVCDSRDNTAPIVLQTHRTAVRRTLVKTDGQDEYRADLVVCPVGFVSGQAIPPADNRKFVKNLLTKPIVPAEGDVGL